MTAGSAAAGQGEFCPAWRYHAVLSPYIMVQAEPGSSQAFVDLAAGLLAGG